MRVMLMDGFLRDVLGTMVAARGVTRLRSLREVRLVRRSIVATGLIGRSLGFPISGLGHIR